LRNLTSLHNLINHKLRKRNKNLKKIKVYLSAQNSIKLKAPKSLSSIK